LEREKNGMYLCDVCAVRVAGQGCAKAEQSLNNFLLSAGEASNNCSMIEAAREAAPVDCL
jgi:hypothetical protein